MQRQKKTIVPYGKTKPQRRATVRSAKWLVNLSKLTSQKHRVQKVGFELSPLCHGTANNCCRSCRENEVEKPEGVLVGR